MTRIVLLLCLLWPVGANAQEQARPAARAVDPNGADPQALLRSNDPRLEAWGAFFAGQYQLHALAPDLQRVLALRLGGVTAAERGATDAALDALIQLKAQVGAETIALTHPWRPAQAMVLLSLAIDQPVDDVVRGLLQSETGIQWLAAAGIGLSRRTPALVAALLQSMTLAPTVVVSDIGSRIGIGSGGGAGAGCGAPGLAPGLPPLAAYALVPFPEPGATVLAAGPRPVYYRRRVSPAGQSAAVSTVYAGGPTASDRIAFVAAAGGLDASQLPLTGNEQFPVSLSPTASVDAEVERVRHDVAARYARLLALLVASRALSQAEADALATPRIDVQIRDLRTTATR